MRIIDNFINKNCSIQEFISIINENIGKEFNSICNFKINGIIKGIYDSNDTIYVLLEKNIQESNFWLANINHLGSEFKYLNIKGGKYYYFFSFEKILKSL